MKVYLDINGTLIYRTLEKGKIQVKPAGYLKEFLQNALERHDVYWLSTMCNGDAEEVLAYLGPLLPPDVLELAAKVKPTKWGSYKVEAINLKEEFLWFDDVLMLKEEEILKNAGKLESFVRVSHYKKDDFFKDWLHV